LKGGEKTQGNFILKEFSYPLKKQKTFGTIHYNIIAKFKNCSIAKEKKEKY